MSWNNQGNVMAELTIGHDEVNAYIDIIDNNANGNTYYCRAVSSGTSVSKAAAVWSIQRKRVVGVETFYEWADGNTLFDNVYNDRTTLTYVEAV